ncbi:DUF302 domain-containing protein [Phenylobacterium sp. NIBR 498073]|uniref:DUF302 domain-containing protein n=1 Tax=Phenylobacterium sp. NIBR 498073 TaxID=3015177 RepID=UPI0022B52523|nr:DUF302 domain-containing protein [Phenylobacterium sp. NIBR 498073]MBS0491401.1 DUF302 domain-containing protein [Pseudomonadota bacterium]WGU41277.1 DUF302 domain-containing protein [Phenylobacterium sp. NIBR 498073]
MYYFAKSVAGDFVDVVAATRRALAAEGFGVISEIDVQATLKAKLDVDFRPYLILGACNPAMAHQALLLEDKVGTMLPCNVVVQLLPNGQDVEVAAVNPIASMGAIDNPDLRGVAAAVGGKLQAALSRL